MFSERPKTISHPEVGKYFCEFTGSHYVPNAEKLEQYPEDYVKTLEYVSEQYGQGASSAS